MSKILSRDKQIELMKTAKMRREARIERWKQLKIMQMK